MLYLKFITNECILIYFSWDIKYMLYNSINGLSYNTRLFLNISIILKKY